MLRRIVFVCTMLSGLAAQPWGAAADARLGVTKYELGLTPDQVLSLWTNINNSLLRIGQLVSSDRQWRARLSAIAPRQFEDKKPSDVLERLETYRSKFDGFRQRAGLAPIKRPHEHRKEVTPSIVYLNSGHLLNGHVEWLILHSSSDQLISRYYADHKYSGKVPSDVFALVDLADRRLDAIRAEAGRHPPVVL